MIKKKNKTHLEKFKHFSHWVKIKIILIITAFMLGMSNAMYDEDKMINRNQNYTEQEQKKD
ncbi:MAG: hypothetical protein L3J09_12940 [Flavobacteriaceae bacterium]|nr:hypothetical protein [Flavobacteriaceae bacterium]